MKLIVTDLDGTLLSDKKEVSEFNRDVINRVIKEKNMDLIIASGRDIYSIKNITKDLKVKYYICFNGAKVYKENELLTRENIDEVIGEDILKEGMKLGLKFSATTGKEIHYTKMDNEYTRLTSEKDTLHFIELKTLNDIKRRKFEKIVFSGKENELIKLRRYIEKNYDGNVNVFYSGKGVMDIVNKNCSKGSALEKIILNLGIEKSEVIAFGDNENDISMLEIVGHPVLMENSREDLRSIRYYKTESNNNDGVGKYIVNNILNK